MRYENGERRTSDNTGRQPHTASTANRVRATADSAAATAVRGGGGSVCGGGRGLDTGQPQQSANAMTAVRSCFAAAAVLSFVATSGRHHLNAAAAAATDTTAQVLFSTCCASPDDGEAACRTGNRTFHRVETIGGEPCANWPSAEVIPVRKCCAPEWTYDPEIRFCRPPAAGTDGDAVAPAFRRLLQLDRLARPAGTAVVGYNYEPPKCGAADVLVDVAADELELLLRDGPPPSYCFDLPWSADSGHQQHGRLVARTCRPRDQYCSGGRYTCANKCCRGDRMIGGK